MDLSMKSRSLVRSVRPFHPIWPFRFGWHDQKMFPNEDATKSILLFARFAFAISPSGTVLVLLWPYGALEFVPERAETSFFAARGPPGINLVITRVITHPILKPCKISLNCIGSVFIQRSENLKETIMSLRLYFSSYRSAATSSLIRTFPK